jgi:hypothetical protein
MGHAILSAVFLGLLYFLFCAPLTDEEKAMPDIIEEYKEDKYRN